MGWCWLEVETGGPQRDRSGKQPAQHRTELRTSRPGKAHHRRAPRPGPGWKAPAARSKLQQEPWEFHKDLYREKTPTPFSWPSQGSKVLASCTHGYAVNSLRTLLTPSAPSSSKTSFSDPAAQTPQRNLPKVFLSSELQNFGYNQKMPKSI